MAGIDAAIRTAIVPLRGSETRSGGGVYGTMLVRYGAESQKHGAPDRRPDVLEFRSEWKTGVRARCSHLRARGRERGEVIFIAADVFASAPSLL
jgi:hypothetical protein